MPTVDPIIPPMFRTVCYIAGALLGLGAAPALITLGLPAWAGVAAAFSGAFNALAFGHRPTRTSGT